MPLEIIPDEIVSELVVLAIIGGFAWLAGMYHCIRKQSQRSWRLSQAIALIAQIEDETISKFHKSKGEESLFTKVDRILKDSKGNY